MKPTGVKPLNLAKLRKDMQIVMDEIDRSGGVLADAYSPVMWHRLQATTERVANAIQAVRLKLGGMSAEEIAGKLGLNRGQVAAYSAWNTMLQPDWVAPSVIIAGTPCPACGAQKGESCGYRSAPIHNIHRERREAHRLGTASKKHGA